SSRRRHTRFSRDWSSDVCSSDLVSHEINNPLTVLQLRLGRLLKRCPAEDADTLDDIETSIQAADEIQNVTVTLRSVVQPVSTHRSEERRVGKGGRRRGAE